MSYLYNPPDPSTFKLDDLGLPDDNTDLNATTSAHGLLKKLSGVSTEFMNGQGNWATTAGGGITTLAKTTNYTITTSDGGDLVVLCSASSGAFTISLPTAVGNVQRITVVKTDSSANAVTIDPNGAQTIGSEATLKCYVQGDLLSMVSDNANWQIVGEKVTIFAQVSRNTGQSGVPTGTLTKAQFNFEAEDTAGAFDHVTNQRFTAPRAGVYHINGQIAFLAPGATRCRVLIYKNGSAVSKYAWCEQQGTAASTLALDLTLRLATNDYIELFGEHNKGSTDGFDANATAMEVHYLGGR